MLRRAVVWAMNNPRRWSIVAVVALGVVPLIVALTIRGVGASQSGSPDQSSEHQTGSVVSSAQHPNDTAAVERPASEKAGRAVVDRFLSGYLGPTSRENLEQLRSVTTTTLASGLALTDPSALPLGPANAVALKEIGAHIATFLVTIPSGRLRLEIVRDAGDWRIANVVRELE